MGDDDKLLYEYAKKALKIGNLEELALRLNYAKTTSTNWYKSGFNDTVRMKIEKAIAESSNKTILFNDRDAYSNYTKQVLGNRDIEVHHRQNINSAGGYGAINEDESAEIIMVSEQMLRAMFGLSTFENLDIINVTGNSMKPIVEDGDTIMVRRTNEVKNNQIAIVRVADQLYIKYFQRHPLGKWIKLSSEDKENYPDMDFDGQEVNEVQVIGLLIGKFKPY